MVAPLGLLEIAAAGMVWYSVCGAGVAIDVAASVVVGVLVLVTAVSDQIRDVGGG